MKEVEQRKAAKAFAEKWKGIGDEKQDTHTFWIELFQKVFGVKDATDQFKLRASEILCPWDNRSPPNGCIQ